MYAEAKSPLASKTLWVNGLTIAVAVLTALTGMADSVPSEAMPYIVGGLALANMILRAITTQPVINP